MPLLTPVLKPVMVEEVLGKTLIRLEILEVLVTSLICFLEVLPDHDEETQHPVQRKGQISMLMLRLNLKKPLLEWRKKLNIQE